MTDQVLETLVKITGFPIGLFKETDSKTRISITVKTFFCDADIDEYNVLINGKDEIIEIKNSDFTWTKELIADLLSPRNQPQPVATQTAATVQAVHTQSAQPTRTLPPQITIPPVNYSYITQYLVDYIILNPTCISQIILDSSGTQINESLCHSIAAWEFVGLRLDEDSKCIKIYDFEFVPITGNSDIDLDINASVLIEVNTMQIKDVYIR